MYTYSDNLDSLVVGCWLRVREVKSSIPDQDRIIPKTIQNGTSSYLVQHSTLKGNTSPLQKKEEEEKRKVKEITLYLKDVRKIGLTVPLVKYRQNKQMLSREKIEKKHYF